LIEPSDHKQRFGLARNTGKPGPRAAFGRDERDLAWAKVYGGGHQRSGFGGQPNGGQFCRRGRTPFFLFFSHCL